MFDPFAAAATQEPFYKEQFASFMFAGFSPFLAALKIWTHPDQRGYAYSISKQWAEDPYVLEHLDKLNAAREAENKPPSKTALVRMVQDKLPFMKNDDFLKGARLIAEMCGHIEKPAPVQVNNAQQTVVNRVMIVTDKGTDDEWEQRLAAQQAKLVQDD